MPKKRRYHHGDLRRALLDAALALLEAEGPGALSLREVARRVGVSHAAPLHHFRDKAALLAALAADGYDALTLAMEAGARAARDDLGRLTAAGVRYVAFAVAHPRLFQLMFGGDIDGADALVVTAGERAFLVLLEAATRVLAARGPVTPAELTITVAGAWAAVHGLATLWIAGRLGFARAAFASAEALSREVTELLARALAPPGPTRAKLARRRRRA